MLTKGTNCTIKDWFSSYHSVFGVVFDKHTFANGVYNMCPTNDKLLNTNDTILVLDLLPGDWST